MAPLQEDWQILLSLFPKDWESVAREAGAVTRLRGFDSINDLLRTLLLHVGTGWSLRETAVQAKQAGIADVSSVTLFNRLQQAEGWLRRLCQEMLRDNGVVLEPMLTGKVVRIVDGTIVKEPGKTGSQWRIHYSLRLPSLDCDEFLVSPAYKTGGGERLGHFSWHKEELVLADAGYCHPPGIAAVTGKGAYVCVRLNPVSLPLWDQQGEPIDLPPLLASLPKHGKAKQWPVWVKCGKAVVAGRLCAIRKSEAAFQRAHRKMVALEKRGKGKVTAQRLEYARYVMVFTTLPEQDASAAQVLICYRWRWQIELVFKRLKTIVQLGHVPKHSDPSSRAWLYGKLLVALLAEKLARLGRAVSPWGYWLDEEQASHPQPLA
jgi:hypothetical protein